ncbi:MAG: hypothetical protein A2W25_01405 [candidate division Zixibacteria bacterium RBG_16_53_22]|nr:MAG: hypothetical protein A2W25_01405 [candidate division Zixibacteria bacterium RBG_16_53_22]
MCPSWLWVINKGRAVSGRPPLPERLVLSSKKSKKRVTNKNHTHPALKINKIIILKKKKRKNPPKTYAERVEWLRKKAGQKIAGKKKSHFTPQEKAAITRLFKGTKKKTEDGKIVHVGGLYRWRNAHRMTIKSDKQRAVFERQNIKIAGNQVFISRRQRGEKVRINADGSRTRYIGVFKQKTYPLTMEQLREMLDDPDSAEIWLEELLGPGSPYRLEYGNGFGGPEETIRDLLRGMAHYKSTGHPGADNIVGIMVETRVLQHGKKKAGKKKTSAKSRNR